MHVTVRVCTPCATEAPSPTESHCAVHFSQAPTAHGVSSHICPLHGRLVGMLLVTEAPHSLSNSTAPTLSALRPVGSKDTLFAATSHERILEGRKTHSIPDCVLHAPWQVGFEPHRVCVAALGAEGRVHGALHTDHAPAATVAKHGDRSHRSNRSDRCSPHSARSAKRPVREFLHRTLW